MKFRTALTINPSDSQLKHGDVVVSIGSCFSENIGKKLRYFGFDVNTNAFGTIFHPLALARIILSALDSKETTRICERDGEFYSYDTHSAIHANSEEQLNSLLQEQFNTWVEDIKRAKMLIVTFGSSWGYWLDEEIVANCHKMPGKLFSKRLSEVAEMQQAWEEVLERISSVNPMLEVLFTVSPVRHLKDGIVENSLSKARLLDLAHKLSRGSYFPAYEIVMDDLRDYRFYSEDMIHPNETAINYVFEQFSSAMISPETRILFSQIDKLRKAQEHRVQTTNMNVVREFETTTNQRIHQLLALHPHIVW